MPLFPHLKNQHDSHGNLTEHIKDYGETLVAQAAFAHRPLTSKTSPNTTTLAVIMLPFNLVQS